MLHQFNKCHTTHSVKLLCKLTENYNNDDLLRSAFVHRWRCDIRRWICYQWLTLGY